jgi:DNA end-binding protein Ku
MRALWTGSLSFGLVNIPVKLYGAAEERSLNFRFSIKRTLQPISYQKVGGRKSPLSQKDIVRGYEINGEYVVLNEEDFKRANRRKVETIEIVQFADPKISNLNTMTSRTILSHRSDSQKRTPFFATRYKKVAVSR